MVFAIDIGTRTVVGIVMSQKDDYFVIEGCSIYEHRDRAMFDGQIHNIPMVTDAVKTVKNHLEEQLGVKLEKAAIAAAGRALVTLTAQSEQEIDLLTPIDSSLIKALELDGVIKATEALPISGEEYHCVGYSVVRYLLDSQPIGNLLMQRGRKAGVEVIATFLPRVVVESLLKVMENNRLLVSNLTLEPIAAINVIVPQSMRNLNIALVDIGAGTSDIAISRRGTIFAYGMVPIAGDEITEYLSEKYILDFNGAEKLKRSLNSLDVISFTDILGFDYDLTSKEIKENIKPAVESMALSIAEKILILNGKSPDAVICIGGGALTPGLDKALANALNLPVNRIGIKGRESLEDIKGCEMELTGALYVTPIGIGVSAIKGVGLDYIYVTVNDKKIQVLDINKATVGKALLSAGMEISKIRCRIGAAITVDLNGEVKIIKGTPGKHGEILINGLAATLETEIRNGDIIEFFPAVDGENASPRIKDILEDFKLKKIKINNTDYNFEPIVIMNGIRVDERAIIKDGAKISFIDNKKVKDLFKQLDLDKGEQDAFYCYINGTLKTFENQPYTIKVNGIDAKWETEICNHDNVDYSKNNFVLTLKDLERELPRFYKTISINVNGYEKQISRDFTSFTINGKEATLASKVPMFASVKAQMGKQEIILADVLAELDELISNNPGKRFLLEVNGQRGEFTTTIKNRDNVVISWY